MRRAVLLLAACVLGGCSWRTPPLTLETRFVPESSMIFAADGALVTTLHAEENREQVPLERVPPHLRDAVVAIEDERFWQHNGVDAKAVVRALYANAEEGAVLEGGSTITQQYVKNELVGRDRDVRRKVREAALAYQLEKRYPKERILELYLNTIYFGNGAYGVQAAARTYFRTPVERLTLGQAALLAGLIRAPVTTDPFTAPERAAARRRAVLDTMVRLGLVPPAQAEAAAAEPLLAAPAPTDERYPAPHFVERVKRFILDDPRFGDTPAARRRLLFQGGLRITTTLDLERQAQAEEALRKVLSQPAADPAGALVSLEPSTGFVRALVGGRDFFGGGAVDKFDLASQGRRPAGSAFKPFVLAAAVEAGIPLSRVYDAPARLTLPLSRQAWKVENYEGGGGGREDLREATVRSTNTVYAQLVLEVGPAKAVETAARMGVASPLAPFPSAVLGTNDVSPLDMAAGYATLANRGVAVAPTFVTRVTARDGSVLFEHRHRRERVLRRETADAVVAVLQEVVERGTGVAARIGRPAAGKTGTGQEWRDAWFVGFTPQLVTSVWVGFPEGQRSMVPPVTRVRVTGGSWPAQIWQLYTSAALASVPVQRFPDPPPMAGDGRAVLLQVPNVIGMPAELAQSVLDREGFRAVRQDVPSDTYPPGYVVAQAPAAEQRAPGGSTVTISVGSGPATTAVPDLLDLSAGEARARVDQAGLLLRVVIQEEPASAGAAARRGRVWKQAPTAGTRLEPRARVTVYVNPD